ncbi:hypothetical protein BKK56_09070 [Rodentibacter genomosp. 2]|uniref:hypothetical protein n=1 Tax=Rodentibacter genomosp. 2 TaxID=1908266 RepID=UPI0009863DDD|nr:hypothetical protein BKK56_09070 [Rodentibacter genomosp. 2]
MILGTADTQADDTIDLGGFSTINLSTVLEVTSSGLTRLEFMVLETPPSASLRIMTDNTPISANGNGTVGLGNNITNNATNLNQAVTAGDVINAINNSGWHTNAGGNLKTGTTAKNTLINPGKAVNFTVDEGLTINQTVGSDGNVTYTFDAKAVKDGVDGKNAQADGLIFTGNNEDTLNRHKLNTVVKVGGEDVNKTISANFNSAAGNINVKADGQST